MQTEGFKRFEVRILIGQRASGRTGHRTRHQHRVDHCSRCAGQRTDELTRLCGRRPRRDCVDGDRPNERGVAAGAVGPTAAGPRRREQACRIGAETGSQPMLPAAGEVFSPAANFLICYALRPRRERLQCHSASLETALFISTSVEKSAWASGWRFWRADRSLSAPECDGRLIVAASTCYLRSIGPLPTGAGKPRQREFRESSPRSAGVRERADRPRLHLEEARWIFFPR